MNLKVFYWKYIKIQVDNCEKYAMIRKVRKIYAEFAALRDTEVKENRDASI